MNSRLRPQIQRILHLIEGGRDAALLQPFLNEAKEFELLAGQHRGGFSGLNRALYGAKQIMNEHYLFVMCSATL